LSETNTIGYKEWQLETYGAIIAAYQEYLDDRKARLAAQDARTDVRIAGRNPAQNEMLIRTELQRSCLSMLKESDLDEYTGFKSGQDWSIDVPVARGLATEVGFFQTAFEWRNMTYLFYPYFWGRKGGWSRILHSAGDVDPAMTAFLGAGSARVQVPVRPGFERAVARYCQDKTFAEYADAAMIDDDLYVPIVTEIMESLDAPDGGVAVDDPWEVRVPTSLILLEDAADLVGFRDRLFGDKATGLSKVKF
jgi:hypothetical protein